MQRHAKIQSFEQDGAKEIEKKGKTNKQEHKKEAETTEIIQNTIPGQSYSLFYCV